MAAEKTLLRKQDQSRSTSASGCLSTSRDDLRKTVILSQHDRHVVRSRPSSQTLGGPDCSQYLEDYRSYLEHKDRDEPTDVQTERNKTKNTDEKHSKFQGNCGKFRSRSAANGNRSQKLPSSPVPSRDFKARPNSIDGSIISQSQQPSAKNSPRSRFGSQRPLSRCRSSQLHDATSSDGKFLPKSATSLGSIEGRSTQRLPNFGIASVELKSDRDDKVLTRKSEEVAVQTDPELAVNVVQNSCVQTDDVRDDLSYSESDVSIDEYKDNISDHDDEINDVRSDTEEEEDDYREDEDFSHGEDINKSEKGRFTFSYEDLTTSRPEGVNTCKRGSPSRSGKAINCEFDSGIGNTASQELSSVWDGIAKSGQHRSPSGEDRSQRKPQQRVRQQFTSLPDIDAIQLQDFGQQTIDFHSTQSSMRLQTGSKRTQQRILGAVSPGDWLLMDSGQESGVYMEPWTLLGMAEAGKRNDERKIVRNYATQTFGQVSSETQTYTEEGYKLGPIAYLEEDNDRGSNLYHHCHTSKPLKERPDAKVVEDGKGDEEDRWSHDRTFDDQWDDDLTEEIIRVFKETRRLIAKAKAGKQPEAEVSSGKRKLLEMMLREVQNLKSRVGREESGARDVRVSGKDGGRRRRKKPMKVTDSDSAIESSEDEERRRMTELHPRTPYDRHDRPRRKDRSWRYSERNTSSGSGLHGGRHHFRREPDTRYKQRTARPDRTEPMLERHQGFLLSVPPPISQQLPPRYQRNDSFPYDSRIWDRSVQGPPLTHYHSVSPWHNQRPNDPVALNPYPGQIPHASVSSMPLPVSAAPWVYWRQPTPTATLPSSYQHLPNHNLTSLRSGTGALGLSGAFRPTQAASTLQKPNVVFFPGTPVGIVHPGLPVQGHPPVSLSQQGSVSYVPTQSSHAILSQPSEVHPVQGRPVAARPTQGEGLPVGPVQQATKSVSIPQYPPQTSAQRRRKGHSGRWKDSEFEFEKSIKQAAVEADRIKELSNRLLRQTDSQTAI